MKKYISIPGKTLVFPGFILLFLVLGCQLNSPIELNFQWKQTFPGANSFYPIFNEDKIVLSSLDEDCTGGIYALDEENGKTLWELCDTSSKANFYYKLQSSVNENSLILPKGNELLSVELNSGIVDWKTEMYTTAEPTIVSQEDLFYRTYYDNINLKANVLSIDKETGKNSLFYQHAMLPNTITKLRSPVYTNYRNESLAHFAITVYNTKEKYGDAYVLTFDPATNAIVDSVNVFSNDRKGKGITKELIIDGKFIYIFASTKVIKYNIDEKTIVWEKTMPADMVASKPLFTNDNIFFAAENGILYSIDIDTGEIIWETKISGTPSCIERYQGHLFLIGGGDGLLYIIKEATGELYQKLSVTDLNIQTTHGFYRAFGINNDKIYLMTPNEIHCYRLHE